jgi:3-deoxy-7-phosphoheptulonate synthase
MVLVDFHPFPSRALVDAPQALPVEFLPQFLEDVQMVHETYQRRRDLARRYESEALKFDAEAVAV